jgi:hypothetical protein
MSSTISITQALAELKLLEKRINKSLDNVKWSDVSSKNNNVDELQLKKTAESEYQSYTDLLKRRDTMKRAIVMSNAITNVIVGKWSGSVAEAIEQKSNMEFKKKLLASMRRSLLLSQESYKRKEAELETRLDRLLTSELGKDIKTNPDTIQALTTSFKETNKVTHHDPLKLVEKIKNLEEEIEDFETNINWKLSESNGKTTVTL